MDQVTIQGLSGGGGGIVGVITAWLGFKSKIKGLEKRVDSLADSVRYEDTCDEICKANLVRLDSIEKMQKEMRLDIKTLLTRKGKTDHG